MTLEAITVKEHALHMSCYVLLSCHVEFRRFISVSLPFFCEQICTVANLLVIVSRRLRIV